ncbi:unnamed protein product [marine sediment metagenome]|uniref:Uncharacterized protein n=1 Tax=marine sediment metagenome TaxID=412755 RepID=X1BMN2_9ZZZZ
MDTLAVAQTDWVGVTFDVLRFIVYALTIIIGIATILGWRKRGWGRSLLQLAKTGNAFAGHILPSILQKFEDSDLAPKGTLRDWTVILGTSVYKTDSPKVLNTFGEKVLEESGIKAIIDTHYTDFSKAIDRSNPQTPLDVEGAAFYVLVKREDSDLVKPIDTYLFKNPGLDINYRLVALAGSFYLRDKYFEKHPELSGETGDTD